MLEMVRTQNGEDSDKRQTFLNILDFVDLTLELCKYLHNYKRIKYEQQFLRVKSQMKEINLFIRLVIIPQRGTILDDFTSQ